MNGPCESNALVSVTHTQSFRCHECTAGANLTLPTKINFVFLRLNFESNLYRRLFFLSQKDALSQLHTRGMHLCNKLRSLNRIGRMRIQKARELTAEVMQTL